MKKLLLLAVAFTGITNAMAQMSQADMNITGAGQPLYVKMDGIKNNKVSYLRETAYVVDTTTHQADMNKIEKITVFNFAYFGNTPLMVKQLAVMGTDTNKLVRNDVYVYDPSTGLLRQYQSVSDEGFETGVACEVARNMDGVITGKSSAITFDLKKPAKPTDYKVMCSGGTGPNVNSAILKYTSNGKEVMDRIHMDYDNQNRLATTIFDYADGNNSDKNTITYNEKGKIKQEQWAYTHSRMSYQPATEGTVAFGVYIPGSPAKQVKKTDTDISTADYEYDAEGRLITIIKTYNGKTDTKEVYSYSSKGLPETVKIFNGKGQLTGLRKFICK